MNAPKCLIDGCNRPAYYDNNNNGYAPGCGRSHTATIMNNAPHCDCQLDNGDTCVKRKAWSHEKHTWHIGCCKTHSIFYR